MKLKIIFITNVCALAVLAGSAATSAQEKRQDKAEIPVVKTVIGGVQGDSVPPPPPPSFPGARSAFGGGFGGMQSPDRMIQFASSEMGFDNRVVLNAAFSGELVYENIQTLSDGNRIINRSTTTIYRDGLGRTRREQVFNLPGQPPGGPNERRVIYINDVVGGTSYTIDPINRTAVKTNAGSFRTASGGRGSFSSRAMPVPSGPGIRQRGSGGGLESNATRRVAPPYPQAAKEAKVQGAVQVKVSVNENGEVVGAEVVSGPDLLRDAALEAAKQWQFKPMVVGGNAVAVQGVLTFNFNLQGGDGGTASSGSPAASMMPMYDISGNRIKVESKSESLGTQMVDGIAAEGTRYTDTIPAGAIGNERQIDIVRERWYSPELQMVILIRHSDPRYGETTQRLSNIDRSEPDTSLFSVDGYEIKEGFGQRFMEQRIEQMKKRRQDEQ